MIRTLVVDDQPAFRAQLCHLLTDAGLDVVGETGDIPQAEVLAQTLQPELAVVDIMLPGVNGFEGTRRLKALLPGLRVIVISAYGDATENLQTAAVAAGAEKFVLKDDLEPRLVKGWLAAKSGEKSGYCP